MKKAQSNPKPARTTTSGDAARMQSSVARKSGGGVATGSYVGRIQATAARNGDGAAQGKKSTAVPTQKDRDNSANQRNPNSDVYWQSRGLDARPDDWAAQTSASEAPPGR